MLGDHMRKMVTLESLSKTLHKIRQHLDLNVQGSPLAAGAGGHEMLQEALKRMTTIVIKDARTAWERHTCTAGLLESGPKDLQQTLTPSE